MSFHAFYDCLAPHVRRVTQHTLLQLLKAQPQRAEQYQLTAAGLTLNYAQQFLDEPLLAAACSFFEASGMRDKIKAMFEGQAINQTEGRPVLHTALRSQQKNPLWVEGKNIRPEIERMLHKMQVFCEGAHPFTDFVCMGIGGSDLGPRMIVRALRPYHQGRYRLHFVSNLDGADLDDTLNTLKPETTGFILSSKSFTTEEMRVNAELAKTWLQTVRSADQVRQHFFALTAHPERAEGWGVPADHIFQLWDYVGGRYSWCSVIGLPIALAVGFEHFKSLLAGAEAMDLHFLQAPFRQNMPFLLALASIVNQNFLDAKSHAILPYDQSLELLPSYFQQLDMESNGKRVTMTGQPVDYQTGVPLWGGVGTNGQHAFHQLLHQGTVLIPADFILPLRPHHPYLDSHLRLRAHCYAQRQALLEGLNTSNAHQAIPGNRPSNLLTFPQLTPFALGALLALYEHKVFVQSLIWEINAFDQWGVELGKQLARPILEQLQKHA